VITWNSEPMTRKTGFFNKLLTGSYLNYFGLLTTRKLVNRVFHLP
jgi:hypothetical protein